jgi:hypothetical protein
MTEAVQNTSGVLAAPETGEDATNNAAQQSQQFESAVASNSGETLANVQAESSGSGETDAQAKYRKIVGQDENGNIGSGDKTPVREALDNVTNDRDSITAEIVRQAVVGNLMENNPEMLEKANEGDTQALTQLQLAAQQVLDDIDSGEKTVEDYQEIAANSLVFFEPSDATTVGNKPDSDNSTNPLLALQNALIPSEGPSGPSGSVGELILSGVIGSVSNIANFGNPMQPNSAQVPTSSNNSV